MSLLLICWTSVEGRGGRGLREEWIRINSGNGKQLIQFSSKSQRNWNCFARVSRGIFLPTHRTQPSLGWSSPHAKHLQGEYLRFIMFSLQAHNKLVLRERNLWGKISYKDLNLFGINLEIIHLLWGHILQMPGQMRFEGPVEFWISVAISLTANSSRFLRLNLSKSKHSQGEENHWPTCTLRHEQEPAGSAKCCPTARRWPCSHLLCDCSPRNKVIPG